MSNIIFTVCMFFLIEKGFSVEIETFWRISIGLSAIAFDFINLSIKFGWFKK